MNKQITPKQAGSVCFLPCAASALCWPNIPLGFAAFPLALLTFHWGCFMTRRQGEVQWAKAAMGPERGRGAKRFSSTTPEREGTGQSSRAAHCGAGLDGELQTAGLSSGPAKPADPRQVTTEAEGPQLSKGRNQELLLNSLKHWEEGWGNCWGESCPGLQSPPVRGRVPRTEPSQRDGW